MSTTHRGLNRRRDEPETLPPFVQELAEKWNGQFSVFSSAFYNLTCINVCRYLRHWIKVMRRHDLRKRQRKRQDEAETLTPFLRELNDKLNCSHYFSTFWLTDKLSRLMKIGTKFYSINVRSKRHPGMTPWWSIQPSLFQEDFPHYYGIWQLCSVLTPKASFSPPAPRMKSTCDLVFKTIL